MAKPSVTTVSLLMKTCQYYNLFPVKPSATKPSLTKLRDGKPKFTKPRIMT